MNEEKLLDNAILVAQYKFKTYIDSCQNAFQKRFEENNFKSMLSIKEQLNENNKKIDALKDEIKKINTKFNLIIWYGFVLIFLNLILICK